MIIYQTRLGKKKDIQGFVDFMRDEYFPAVHKGPTRVGQVTSLELLKSDSPDATAEFYWHVGWSGLSTGDVQVVDEEVLRKLEFFGARIKRVGFYHEVSVWHANKVANA